MAEFQTFQSLLFQKRATFVFVIESAVPIDFNTGYRDKVAIDRNTKLASLVGPDSWLIFRILKIEDSSEWLGLEVPLWKKYDSFIKLSKFIKGIAVVNDTAERGIKLVQEYANSSRDEELRQDILLSVRQFKSKVNSTKMTKACFCNAFSLKILPLPPSIYFL